MEKFHAQAVDTTETTNSKGGKKGQDIESMAGIVYNLNELKLIVIGYELEEVCQFIAEKDGGQGQQGQQQVGARGHVQPAKGHQ